LDLFCSKKEPPNKNEFIPPENLEGRFVISKYGDEREVSSINTSYVAKLRENIDFFVFAIWGHLESPYK
jgi:hypothetical protein